MKFLITFSLLSIFLLPFFTAALPTPDNVQKSPQKQKLTSVRHATKDEIRELEFYTSLSADVYCSDVMKRKRLDCPHCDIAIAHGLTIIDTIISDDYDTNVMVARSNIDKAIYVAFRGSNSLKNWGVNFRAVPVPYYHNVDKAYVHLGFKRAYQIVQKQLTAIIDNQLQIHPDYTVAVTGHSLGGALALLNALDLHERGIKNVELITFGQPRVGNKQFAEYVVSTGIPYKRAVHARDTVPHVPDNASPLYKFYHAGEEFWDDNELFVVCPNGIESNKCSSSLGVGSSPLDHMRYFGITTGICIP
ncbi:Alpha/Beta hydrolase protein [Circinella umbellata]|nr:Alpha/Beta hydrolase protein [Circinella umbellata]